MPLECYMARRAVQCEVMVLRPTSAISIIILLWVAAGLLWLRSSREVDQMAVDAWRLSICVGSHYGYLTAYVSWNRYDAPRWSARCIRQPSDYRSPSGLVWYEYTAHWDATLYSEPSGYRVIGATVPLWFIGFLLTLPTALIAWRRRPRPNGQCRCGYDLRGGHVSGLCPECGVAIAP